MDVQSAKLSSGAYCVWEQKTTTFEGDDQVLFLDNSVVQVDFEDPNRVFGQFIGDGTLGVGSAEELAVQTWVRLLKTNFKIGFTDKQLVPQMARQLKGNQAGFRQFGCGSQVEFTADVVKFSFVGDGLLVVRYQPVGVVLGQIAVQAAAPLPLGPARHKLPELVGV